MIIILLLLLLLILTTTTTTTFYMAVQPNSGPGLPLWAFVRITFLHVWIISPAPNPQPGGPRLRIFDPRRQGGPAIPPGTGTHFNRLSLIPATTRDTATTTTTTTTTIVI
jgi:hypothetical protein